MPRFLLALCLSAALAAPAAARIYAPPAAVATPPRVQNYIEAGRAEDGSAVWFDANSIITESYYRTAMFRFDGLYGRVEIHWLRFDCDGGRYQEIIRIDQNNGVLTPVPSSSGWIDFDESRRLVGSAVREALCNWRR